MHKLLIAACIAIGLKSVSKRPYDMPPSEGEEPSDMRYPMHGDD